MGKVKQHVSTDPWADPFRQPTHDDLCAHYGKQLTRLFDTARSRLQEFEGVESHLAWHGVPWRWTVVFECPDDPTRAWAYLVADPQSPKLAVPLTPQMVQALPLKRLKRHVRDGVEGGTRVADTIWVTLEFSNLRELDDVLDVVKRKLRFIAETRRHAQESQASSTSRRTGRARSHAKKTRSDRR